MLLVVECRGQWLALLGWSAAAYHIRARDQWISWTGAQPTTRSLCGWVANNARFCLLTDRGQYPNLASRAMALNLARLSSDWQQAYGHPIVLVESFVDSQLFRGTAYKASGWRECGPEFRLQNGWRRISGEAYDRPKQLYVCEVVKHAARKLRQRRLPETLREHERKVDPSCQMPNDELLSFWHTMHRQVPESRNVRGLRHRQATVLTLTFAFFAQWRPGRPSRRGCLCAGLVADPAGLGAPAGSTARPRAMG